MSRGRVEAEHTVDPSEQVWVGGRAKSARVSLSDSISAEILEMVRRRGLKPGDALPNARALSKHFDVATPTVREALRGLEATGSVELRHGSGIYVGSNLSRMLLPNPHAGVSSTSGLLQMLDARLLIEPGVARLAAERDLTQEEADALLESISISERQEPGEVRNALTFHRQLANSSANVVLFEVIDSMLSVRWREQKVLRRLYDDRTHDKVQHREIADAVLAGKADLAEDLTRSHLAEIRTVLEKAHQSERRH